MVKTSLTLDPSAEPNVGEEYTTTEKTKLTGIEANAAADQTGAEIKTAYEGEVNAYTDTKDTKLTGIAEGAQPDQTGNEVRDLILALSDTERKILITEPVTGQFKVISVERKVDGKINIQYDDVAVL